MRSWLQHIRKSVVAKNALSLLGVQFTFNLSSLITIPYLARVLGQDIWGLFILTQSFAAIILLVIEYGFGYSATRDVAQHREDDKQLAHIASGIFGAKGLLLLAAGVFSGLAFLVVSSFQQEPLYLIMGTVAMATSALGPWWYFQGIERMRKPAILAIITISLTTAGIFLVVGGPEDGWKVFALQAFFSAINSGTMLWWLYREVSWQWPTWHEVRGSLQRGTAMFVQQLSVSLYSSANAFILGLFVHPIFVGYYGGAEKLVRVAKQGIETLSRALYPRMSYLVAQEPQRARKVRGLLLFAVGGMALVFTGLGMLMAPWLVRLILGPGYEAAILPLRILLLSVPAAAITNILGTQWLLPQRKDQLLVGVTLATGALNIVLAALLAPSFAQNGMAWAVVSAEFFAAASFGLLVWRSDRKPQQVIENMA